MRNILCGSILLILLAACQRSKLDFEQNDHNSTPQFVKYTILSGQQYCDQNVFKQTDYTELKFIVKFDSTAIYQTISSSNQEDVNKLYGFSDNDADHHQFSARIGWRWSNGALRLFGYVYNNSVMSFEELGKISIGEEHNCSIKITPAQYIFNVGNISKSMPRASSTATAIGYKLYPYFGGNETAPHAIYIWIKEL